MIMKKLFTFRIKELKDIAEKANSEVIDLIQNYRKKVEAIDAKRAKNAKKRRLKVELDNKKRQDQSRVGKLLRK